MEAEQANVMGLIANARNFFFFFIFFGRV